MTGVTRCLASHPGCPRRTGGRLGQCGIVPAPQQDAGTGGGTDGGTGGGGGGSSGSSGCSSTASSAAGAWAALLALGLLLRPQRRPEPLSAAACGQAAEASTTERTAAFSRGSTSRMAGWFDRARSDHLELGDGLGAAGPVDAASRRRFLECEHLEEPPRD